MQSPCPAPRVAFFSGGGAPRCREFNINDWRIDAAVPFPIEVRLPDVYSVAENSVDRSSVQQLTAARFGIPGDPVGSKYPSSPVSEKITASSLPRSRLRKKRPRNYCAHAPRQNRRNEWAQWRSDEAHRTAGEHLRIRQLRRFQRRHRSTSLKLQDCATSLCRIDASTRP